MKPQIVTKRGIVRMGSIDLWPLHGGVRAAGGDRRGLAYFPGREVLACECLFYLIDPYDCFAKGVYEFSRLPHP